MLRFKGILISTIAFGMLRITSAVFDKSSPKDVAIYWGMKLVFSPLLPRKGTDENPGQNSKGNSNKDITAQKNLIEYCKSPLFTLVILAFLVNLDLDNLAGNLNFGPSTLNLKDDIKTCQTVHRKTILLSFGGETSTQAFTSSQDAIATAQKIWYTFGPKDPAHPVTRPFGDASLDGFDFDFEANGEAQKAMPFLVDFARELRRLVDGDAGGKKRYLTAAPQCIFPDKLNGEMLDGVPFDAVFIQFYNNPRCGQENFLSDSTKSKFNIDVWDKWAKETSPNKEVQVFLGIPGGSSAVKMGFGYVEGNKLEPILSYCKRFGSFGGVMIWDASQAFGNEGFLDGIDKVLGGAGGGNETGSGELSRSSKATPPASRITPSTASLEASTSLSTRSVAPLLGSGASLSSSLDGSTELSTVRGTSTNTNVRTVDPSSGSDSPAMTPSSGSLTASGGSASAASSSILTGGSSSSPSVLVDAQFGTSNVSPLASSNVAPLSASRSLTVTPFIMATSDVSILDNNSPATGGTIRPETPSLSAGTDASSNSPSSQERTRTVLTTTTSTSSLTSKAKTPSFNVDKGGFLELSRSISSPLGFERTKTSFTSTTTTTTFLSRQTVTVTITSSSSSLATFSTSVRSSSGRSSVVSPSSSMASTSLQSPESSEEPSTDSSTSLPFSLPSPIPTPSESQEPDTPETSETPDTPEESTCPLLEASTVTMSATLIIAQPTTFTEMKTILKTVEKTKTVDRMVTQTETESVTATRTETETVPATRGKFSFIPDSSVVSELSS